jgi:hypothetical protein
VSGNLGVGVFESAFGYIREFRSVTSEIGKDGA